MEAGARVYVPLDVIARCRNNNADGNGTGGRSHRRLSSSGGKGGQGPGTPSAAALSSSTTGAANNGHYWPGQIQDVWSSDRAVVVTVKLLAAEKGDGSVMEPPAAASRGAAGGGGLMGLGPLVRAGEVVTVDLEALHGGRPLPMLDPKVTAQPHGVEDMAALDHLHEAALLHNLARRHALARPYTATGPTVLAVNPYRWLGPLYGERVAADYLAAALDPQNTDAPSLPPHIYATAAAAYRGLVDGGRNQSILVSGESGSGKTESVKIMMGLLAQASSSSQAAAGAATPPSPAAHDGADNGGGQNGAASIVERVLRSNPLLEAFGNAKTVRNDNSSRFGKYQSLEFRLSDGRLVGSHCQTYLLEKSRVVGPPSHQHAGAPSTAKERNYHIFYQLLSAATTSVEEEGMDRAAELLLSKAGGGVGGPAAFRYLRGGDCETDSVEGVTDREAFDRTLQGLAVIGVDAEHRRLLLRALAGILHLGEVDFVAAAAAAEDGGVSGEEEAARVSDLSPTGPLARAAALLLLSEGTGEGEEGEAAMALLADGLCARAVVVRGETLVVPLTVEQAGHARDALAKEVYARLFRWLVGRVNASTAAVHAHAKGRKEAVGRVALLDIFGFECFPHNSFEQLLINYANERLQQQFTQDVFKAVQAEYDEEGVPWEHVDFEDNAETLALLEGRMGVMSLLNEEGLRPKGSDAAFVSKLWAVHGDHPALEQGPTLKAQGAFVIRHYAGAVCYTPFPPSSSSSSSFLEKNRDAMPERLAAALAKGGSPLLASLFRPSEPKKEQTGLGRRGSGALVADTVASQFRKQLGDLMEAVGRTDVRYVRCLKPNASKSPHVFEQGLIADQLRCAGVLEAIRISRAAWPTRLTHATFLRRFRPLLRRALGPSFSNTTTTIHNAAALLLPPAHTPNGANYVIGATKIYFRSGALEGLETQRTALVREAATAMQAQMRRFLAQGRYQAARRATIALQAHHRSRRARRAFLRHRGAAAALQQQWRRTLARRARRRQKEEAAARRIQSALRGYRARTAFASQRAAAARVQAAVRGYLGWKEGRALLAAAREERKLETQLERLKARLEEELTARRAAEARAEQLALSSSSAILEEDGRKRGVTVELEEQSLLTIRRLQAEKAALVKEVAILREDNARLNALVARLRSEKTSQADVAQSMILALHQQQQHQQQQQHREKAAATTASTFTPSPLLSLSPLRPPLPSLAATSPIPTAADTPVNPWHTALPADCVPPPLNSFWTHVPAASVAGGGLEDGAEVHFKSGERYLFEDQGFLRWTIQADPSRGYPANTAFHLERVPPYLLPAPENGGGPHATNHNAVVYALRSAKTEKYVNLGGFFSRQRLRCTVARLQDGAALFRALPLLTLAPPPPPPPLAGLNGGTPAPTSSPSPSSVSEDEGEAHDGDGGSETTTKSVRGHWLSIEEQGLLLALMLYQPSSAAAASSSGFTKPPSALRLTDDGYVTMCKCPPLPPPPPAPSAAGHKRLTTTTTKEGEEGGASSSLVADAASSSPAAGKEEQGILRAPAAAAAYTGGPVPSLLTVEALSPRDSYEIEFKERQLGLRVDPKAMPLHVMGVTPLAPDGTPSEAERTGRIHAGDVVISADGISLLGGSSGDGMTREECLALLQRGPRPTRVGFLVGSALRKARAPGAKEPQGNRASLLSRGTDRVRRGSEGTVGGMMAPAAESMRAGGNEGQEEEEEEEEEEQGQPPPVDPAFAIMDQFFEGVERRLFGEHRANPDEGATAGASSGDGEEDEDDDQGLNVDASTASATAAAAMASFFGF